MQLQAKDPDSSWGHGPGETEVGVELEAALWLVLWGHSSARHRWSPVPALRCSSEQANASLAQTPGAHTSMMMRQ